MSTVSLVHVVCTVVSVCWIWSSLWRAYYDVQKGHHKWVPRSGALFYLTMLFFSEFCSVWLMQLLQLCVPSEQLSLSRATTEQLAMKGTCVTFCTVRSSGSSSLHSDATMASIAKDIFTTHSTSDPWDTTVWTNDRPWTWSLTIPLGHVHLSALQRRCNSNVLSTRTTHNTSWNVWTPERRDPKSYQIILIVEAPGGASQQTVTQWERQTDEECRCCLQKYGRCEDLEALFLDHIPAVRYHHASQLPSTLSLTVMKPIPPWSCMHSSATVQAASCSGRGERAWSHINTTDRGKDFTNSSFKLELSRSLVHITAEQVRYGLERDTMIISYSILLFFLPQLHTAA